MYMYMYSLFVNLHIYIVCMYIMLHAKELCLLEEISFFLKIYVVKKALIC